MKYHELVELTSNYPEAGTGSRVALSYAVLGLCNEGGEYLEKWLEYGGLMANGKNTAEDDNEIIDEWGDVRWYIEAVKIEVNAAKNRASLIENRQDISMEELLQMELDNVKPGVGDLTLVVAITKIAGDLKKYIRGDFDEGVLFDRVVKNLAYTMRYLTKVSNWAEWMEVDMETIEARNTEKLLSRLERGVIKGDGDKR